VGRLFECVRNGVSALQAAQAYGLEFGRNKRALCPWHNDTKPDLAFYDDGARCYCHACHNGGDSIALTAQLFALAPLEAAHKLNADFRLGLDESAHAPPAGPSAAEVRRDLEAWRRKRFDRVCQVEREAKATLAACRNPESLEFKRALLALGYAQDELEMLHIATTDELQSMREAAHERGY
jgi:hypothetical protein